MSFVHLHVHSEYSLLDGAARVERLAQAAAELGMPALALTDHGALFGAVPFFKACEAVGVRPIIGMEAYVAPRGRFERRPKLDEAPPHLVLLAADEEGYRNLVRLSSAGYTEGFYYKPRIDLDLLAAHHQGLIVLSGCLAGQIPALLAEGRPDEALAVAGQFRDIFGPERFYIELQDHGLADEARVNRGLVELAGRLGLGLVATNDAHYVDRRDARTHDVLLCIQTNATLADPKRLRFPNDEFYLKSTDAMAAAFRSLPEAVANTLRIADRCRFRYRFGQVLLPPFPVPAGHTPDSFLRRRCLEGVGWRYPRLAAAAAAFDDAPESLTRDDPVFRRLFHELSVIASMGYAEYFLIVADFVGYARERGIPVGPGRGSGAGSLVAYLLGITDIDPLRYGLLFERFLNPERVDMPDFDIDFCYERRGEVIDYVVRKYGPERVAQVITFGTLGARAAVRDVGRALGRPYGEVDRTAKLVPFAPGMTLQRALETVPELRRAYRADPRARELIDLARAVEGMPRHASIHAAGVVISRGPLTDHVPLARTVDDHVVTQFGMDELKDVGLLKMDFLGLRTLTVLHECVALVRAAARPGSPAANLDLREIPLDDAATFALLGQGETLGVFQLEAGWVRDFLRRMKPSRFEDVAATVALCRPGPMENIPLYLKAKDQGATYPHPALEPVLRDTYGILVYQEQIMQVAAIMAGFTLGQADVLRRAVGKKRAGELKAQREAFVAGCVRNGHPRDLAERLFDLIERFANYGFARAHAFAYGLLAYQCAYLSCHHPVEYFAALMSSLLGSQEKLALYVHECRRRGIQVLPPDVNRSGARFAPDPERRAIRFGLAAIKHVGVGAIEAVIAERGAGGEFRSFADFCERIDQRHVPRKAIESLVKAGAFDRLETDRARLLATLDPTLEAAQAMQRYRQAGQATLFDQLMPPGGECGPSPARAAAPEPPIGQRLAMEKEVLGLYLSGHPLQPHEPALADLGVTPIGELAEQPDGQRVLLAGVCVAYKRVPTRAGGAMAFLSLEDLTGQAEVVVFPRVASAAGAALAEDAVLVVRGRVQHDEEQVRVLADEISPPQTRERLYLRLPGDGTGPIVGEVRALLAAHRGAMPVFMQFAATRKWVRCSAQLWVDGSPELLAELEALLGAGAAVVARGRT